MSAVELSGGPPKPGLLNVANALTVLRLILVPVFVVCLLAGGTGWRQAEDIAAGHRDLPVSAALLA